MSPHLPHFFLQMVPPSGLEPDAPQQPCRRHNKKGQKKTADEVSPACGFP
jgi:hypothetical protein